MVRRFTRAWLVLLFLGSAWTAAAGQLADEVSRQQALAFYRAGQEFMSAEQFEKAADSFGNAIQKDRLLVMAHYGLGQAHMNLKRFASAGVAYRGCIGAMATLHDLSTTHQFDVNRQRDEQIREIRQEIADVKELSPLKRSVLEQRLRSLEQEKLDYAGPFRPPAFVLLALGSAYFRGGDLTAAELQWKAAVDADRKLGEAHNNLAALYAMSNRKTEAEAAVKAAEKAGFRVNPGLKNQIKALR